MRTPYRRFATATLALALGSACTTDVDSEPGGSTTSTTSSSSSAETCELPLSEMADSCAAYETERADACANADGLEFEGAYGECGAFVVVWSAGFYSERWCIYDPVDLALVGVIVSDDTPASCGALTVVAGETDVDCARPPTDCPTP
jgi:hypothetical protein